MKKHDGLKLCAKSHEKSRIDRFFVHCLEFQNTGNSQCISTWEVVQARFHEKMQRS
ncbi:hypothetical protein BHE74_00023295 [Ensete ventricosum]|nr:hypothetical protein BHE74_00023295 [Ensete ventricosum]